MLSQEIARATLASILHKLKTVKVGHRIVDSRFSSWLCGEGVVVADLQYGAKAIVLANDYNGRAMYLWGEHDPRISAVLCAVLRSGDTVFDIGANFGVTGLLSAKLVGSTGRVHLFEPQPLLASCLRTSLLINGYSNAHVHECALSDHAGSEAMLVIDPTNMGMTTLSPEVPDASRSCLTIQVQIKNALEYIVGLKASKVALIKIDVEGHEAVILSSLREWLIKIRPAVILFECHLDLKGFYQHQTVCILSDLGYDFLAFDTRPFWRTRLYRLSEQQHPVGHDFAAIRWPELDEDRSAALRALMV